MIRLIFTVLIAVCGAYLAWQIVTYANFVSVRRPDGLMSLTSDAPFLLRAGGAALLCIGALAGLTGKRAISRWCALAGALVYGLLTAAIIGAGGDISLWQDEAIWTGGLLVLAAGLFKFR